MVAEVGPDLEYRAPPFGAQKTVQKRNRDTTSIFHRFGMDFGHLFGDILKVLAWYLNDIVTHFAI